MTEAQTEVTIAAAAYPLSWFDSFAEYEAKISGWVGNAAGARAELLVFPEYGAMELASLGGAEVAADLERALHEVARHRPAMDALFCALAARHGIHILGPSGPVFTGERPVNRATLYGPGGVIGHQDKQIMTRFEREEWNVVPGTEGLSVFDTPLGKIGVAICYDSEFPLLARKLAEEGVEILLVPSCTETKAGYWRVRIGAQARALENQCVAAHSCLVGTAPWCAGVEENTGASALYGPPDQGWPEDGLLVMSGMNEACWMMDRVSRDLIAWTRANGGVLNFRHWEEQDARLAKGTVRRGAS
ncbi:carbon-nitrogen hydrolase family protein [Pararhodobacter sp.]|uniref:carbon-nitrogen hydrolase family protein n=1 Tax=Pararhodobacter sp. TaxID=2127056 RepID=UPI002AFFF77E|nr:carbon-nitrogen hydrolase family protein [Pararhodobacter sp.]